jgi:hypothetical protein
MNISSLYQYGSLYMPYNSYTSSASATQGSSQADTDSEDFSAIYGTTLSNSDGDALQGYSGMAGMPPMMGNDTTASDIKSFMEKVANGTATATDLQNMETELEQAASSTGSGTTSSTSSSTGTSSIGDDVKSFMEKVANGTATATDLQNMETELEQEQGQTALLNSAVAAYSNNDTGYLWNSTTSTTV